MAHQAVRKTDAEVEMEVEEEAEEEPEAKARHSEDRWVLYRTRKL